MDSTIGHQETAPQDIESITVKRIEQQDSKLQSADMEFFKLRENIVNVLPELQSRAILFVGIQRGDGVTTCVNRFGNALAQSARHRTLILTLDVVTTGNTKQWHTDNGDPSTSNKAIPLVPNPALIVDDNSGLWLGNWAIDSTDDWRHQLTKFQSLLGALKSNFDDILIDGAVDLPIASICDVASRTDGVVIIIRSEETRSDDAGYVVKRIENNGGRIIGAVLNGKRYG